MRIGLCQLNIVWEDKQETKKKVLDFFLKGKENKVDIVFFPEMTLTGFSMQTDKTKDCAPSETINWFREICRKSTIAAGFGWVEGVKDGKAKNHYSILDEKGELLSDYVKVHPFTYGGESCYFTGGNQVVTCGYKGQNISTAICYDLRFPEMFRIMNLDTTLVVVPANWPASRKEHWKCLLQARAIENQIYIAGVNCVGDMHGQMYSGDSVVFNPLGEQLVYITEEEGMVFCDIPDDVEEYRKKFPVRQDQKIEIRKL